MINRIRQFACFIIIGLVAAACGSSMTDYYDIAIYCQETNIKIKVISDGFSITHNDGPYYYENADFLWLYIGDEEFESSIFNANAMVVYKIENQQIVDSIMFDKTNRSTKNLMLPQNYKYRLMEDSQEGTREHHYSYKITKDYFVSDYYENPLLTETDDNLY
ncbi:MAG: hypothetical protein IKW77_08700 [Salinivirgaceae bacterium]|nr:hypothetical protein [Salinivirgaceae bacterium]